MRFAAVLLVAALLVAGSTATATARTLNTRSDHAALAAYNAYLRALIKRVPIGAHRDQQLIHSVASGCLGYLAPYAKQISSRAGYAFGLEIGGDLAVKFTSSSGRPFHRLAKRLGRLRWSSGRTVTAIGKFLVAEHKLIRTRPSRLCADAIDLGSHPTYVGPGTRRFDRRFTRLTNGATAALAGFTAVLRRYEARGDRRLIRSINRRVNRYTKRYNAVVKGPDQSTLIADLGLSLSSVHARFLSLQDNAGRARARVARASG